MNERHERETIWGIDPRDRKWFQVLTLVVGITISAVLTQLELSYGSAPNHMARNIVLGIGGSFVAAGFFSWAILHSKGLIMAMADWIREQTAKSRKKRERELQETARRSRQEGLQKGIQEGRQEGYALGYADARAGKPSQPPDDVAAISS